jgi:hypothetical protein
MQLQLLKAAYMRKKHSKSARQSAAEVQQHATNVKNSERFLRESRLIHYTSLYILFVLAELRWYMLLVAQDLSNVT